VTDPARIDLRMFKLGDKVIETRTVHGTREASDLVRRHVQIIDEVDGLVTSESGYQFDACDGLAVPRLVHEWRCIMHPEFLNHPLSQSRPFAQKQEHQQDQRSTP